MNGIPYDTHVRAAIGLYAGYLYRGKGEQPKIEAPPEGAPSFIPASIVRKRGERRVTDCSTFSGVGVVATLPVPGGAPWPKGAASDLAIGDAARPFSSIEVVANVGLGRAVDAPVADRWHLAQAWREKDAAGRPVIASGGHAFLWLGGENGTKVHASSSSGRVLAEDATWTAQRERYAVIRLVALEPRSLV